MKLNDITHEIPTEKLIPNTPTTIETENSLSSHIKESANTSEKIYLKHSIETKSANTIKAFLKRVIAAQSYHFMFSNGKYFKILGSDLPMLSSAKSSLSSLDHLNKMSQKYLSEIKGKIGDLTSEEKTLLGKVIDSKIHFRHQSNSFQSPDKLNLFSFKKLQQENTCTKKNTYLFDQINLSNHDFVFFAVEFSGDKSKLPLNTLHSTVDFGAYAYILDDQFPLGYFTLTDHFDNRVPPAATQEHSTFMCQFPQLKKEVCRPVHAGNNDIDVPIYNKKDMKLALGLHLIDFIRKISDIKFQEFALNKDLDDENLDKILNYVFQPEFHVPRMVSTEQFTKVRHRLISAQEAISASNIEILSTMIKNKNSACKAMGIAIEAAKPDVVDYLFSQWQFTSEDITEMSPSYTDIEYILSNYNSSSYILKCFLERGLVNPNTPFTAINSGETMLNNALKYNNTEMIELLESYGAKKGLFRLF